MEAENLNAWLLEGNESGSAKDFDESNKQSSMKIIETEV